MKRSQLLAWILTFVLLCSCQPAGTVAPPQIEFQDVSKSLNTVNPEEQLDLFAYDREAPLDVQEVDRWGQQGLTFIDLTYASPTGNRVPATLVLPKGDGPSAGLVLQHGMPSTRQDMFRTAQAFAQMGVVVVMIDAPWARPERQQCEGYSCKTVPRFTEEDRSDQIELMLDLQRAVDLLLSRPEVDPQRLAYLGVSYGGAMGGLLAGIEKRLQAYVLVVGDGGLVEHTSEPDAAGYPDHWSKAWLDAMWPIEPLHYVGMAAPAALLFQNGTQDILVPPRDALRYQQAGSQPKTVRWYPAGHQLPFTAMQYQTEWLFEYTGAQELFFLRPHFSAAALWLDRLLGVWVLLVVVSLLLLLLDAALATPWTIGGLLSWALVVLFTGPLGLLVYAFTWRQPLRRESPWDALSTARRALGATAWVLSWGLLGVFITIVLVLSFLDLFNKLLWLNILLSIGMPFVSTVLMYLLVRATSRRAGRRFELRWSPLALFLSICIALAVVYPVAVILFNRWLDWYFPFGWYFTQPLMWVILCLGGLSAGLLTYPVVYWLIRRGLVVWQLPTLSDQVQAGPVASPRALSWYQAAGAVLLATVFLLAGLSLAIWATM